MPGLHVIPLEQGLLRSEPWMCALRSPQVTLREGGSHGFRPPSVSNGGLNAAAVWPPSQRFKGFPGGSDAKEPTCNTGDPGLIPGSGRSPGEVNGYPFQYFCLENSMDSEASGGLYIVHGSAKSQT